MSTGGLEPTCRGELKLPYMYAAGPAELSAFRRAARKYIQYDTDVATFAAANRMLPLRKRLGAASVVTAIQGVKAAAAYVPPWGPPNQVFSEVRAQCLS